MKEAKWLAVSLDESDSVSKTKILVIIAHFLDKNLRKTSIIIGIEPLALFDSESITDTTLKILRKR